MRKPGYHSNRIKSDDTKQIKDVTSFTVVNDGASDLTLTISGVSRIVPAVENGKANFFFFDMPFDGTYSDYEIEFSFAGGVGSAILDYKILTKEC